MTDLSNALILESEARREVRNPDGGDFVLIDDLIVEASVEMESELDRQIVTRGTITEYHSFWRPSATLHLHEWPAISVVTVHEDPDRSYGATTLLTVNTDYKVISNDWGAKLIRLSGGSPTTWTTGFEAIQIVYTGGYATTAVVPRDLKRVTRELFAMQYRDVTRQTQNLSNVSDGLGTFQRFGPAFITSEMRKRIARYGRMEFPGGTTYSSSSTA